MLIILAAFAIVMGYLFYAAFVQNHLLAKQPSQKEKEAQEQTAHRMEM